jgi:hypothetical protein
MRLIYQRNRSKALSVSTILLGSIWYTWIKHIESTPSGSRTDLSDRYQRVPTEPKEGTPDLVVEFDVDEETEKMEEGRIENRRTSSSTSSSLTLGGDRDQVIR